MEEPRLDADTKGGGDDGMNFFHVSAPDDAFLCPTTDSGFLHNKPKISMEGEKAFLPSESTESDMSLKNEKYNMRKSLAWDSAFFTSEGVLEPEELSSMIEGTDNSGSKPRQMLSDIPEDLSGSESISTFASDSFLLETLESDLFRDIRASIQKSNSASNLKTSARSKGAEGKEPSTTPRPKVIEPQRGNVAKIPLKKPTGGSQGPAKPIKEGKGLAKPVKDGSAGAQALGKNKKPSSSVSLKTQKASGKISSAINATSMRPPKRTVVGASQLKPDNNKSGSTRAVQVGTVSNRGSLRNVAPKSASSSVRSSTATISVRSSSDSTSSSSVGQNRSSPLSSLQKKANGAAKLPSTSSIQRTPKVGLKGKVQPAGARPSAQPTPTSKQFSNISPASSKSVRSSVSSTSSVTGNKQAYPVEPVLNKQEGKVEKVTSRNVQKSVAGNVSTPNPLSGKPSGLRLPSPKIGFFDGVKGGVRTPAGSMQSRSGLSTNRSVKSGAGSSSPNGVTNKCSPANSSVRRSASTGMASRPARTSLSGLLDSASPKVKGESKVSRLSGSGAGSVNSPANPSKSSPKVKSSSKESIRELSCSNENKNGAEVRKNHKEEIDVAGLRTPFAVKNSSTDVDVVGEARKTST